MKLPKWEKNVSALMTPEFICIKVKSGYRMQTDDIRAGMFTLAADSDVELLGEALLEGIQRSRFLTLPEAEALRRTASEDYQAWISKTMKQFGYRSRRALFKNMKKCFVSLRERDFELSPLHHDKLEGWGRTVGDGIEDIHLPKNATPAELGAALRLAFERCT